MEPFDPSTVLRTGFAQDRLREIQDSARQSTETEPAPPCSVSISPLQIPLCFIWLTRLQTLSPSPSSTSRKVGHGLRVSALHPDGGAEVNCIRVGKAAPQ